MKTNYLRPPAGMSVIAILSPIKEEFESILSPRKGESFAEAIFSPLKGVFTVPELELEKRPSIDDTIEDENAAPLGNLDEILHNNKTKSKNNSNSKNQEKRPQPLIFSEPEQLTTFDPTIPLSVSLSLSFSLALARTAQTHTYTHTLSFSFFFYLLTAFLLTLSLGMLLFVILPPLWRAYSRVSWNCNITI